MTGRRKGKGKEVADNNRFSEFVPSTIHTLGIHTHRDMTSLADNIPSLTSNIPSSRALGAFATSNVPESPATSGAHPLSGRQTNVAQKIFIRPRTKTKFDQQLQCVHKIRELIEMRFEGAWKSWRKFSKDTRDLIFSEFGKFCEWDSTDTRQIRSIFDSCAMSCIKNLMYQLRKSKKKPEWLGEKVFEGLNEIFDQDEFKKESERNRMNRSSDCDGQGFPLHAGGCVSHSEHIDRLEEYTNKLSEASSQGSNGDENLSTQDQIKIFTEVVEEPKKDVIYGLAGQSYHVMHGSSSSMTNRGSSLMEWESKRTQLINQVNEIQSSIEASVKAAVEKKISSMEARIEASVKAAVEKKISSMEARIEASVKAAVEKKVSSMDAMFETKFMAMCASFENDTRGMSVNLQLPKSPSSHQ